MLSVGNSFGAVSFRKRSDNTVRKMAFRIHVKNPTYAKKPEGKIKFRKTQDAENNILTIFDANVVRYNNKDRMCGRGNYRSIPLDKVFRLKVGGTIYHILY